MVSLVLALLVPALGHLVPTAAAFAPAQDGSTQAEPTRIWRVHPGDQTRWRHQPAWQDFIQGDGQGWQAQFDEVTGTAHRAWGPGIQLADVSSASAVVASVLDVFAANPGLLGVPLDQIVLHRGGYVEANDTWYLSFDRMVPDGAGGANPIWRGSLRAQVHGDRLVMFRVDTWPGVESLGGPQISSAEAERLATLSGPAALADHTHVTSALTIIPWDRDGQVYLRLCYEVRSQTTSPIGKWVTLVDAATGEWLNTSNDVKFFSGTILGHTNTRTLDGNYTDAPLPLLAFNGSDGSRVYAAEDGSFSLSDSTSWTAGLNGSYVTVVNNDRRGGNGSKTITSSDLLWTTEDATQAEIDTYKFVFDVRAWGLSIVPDVGMMTDPLDANVNINSSCNAYYDGAVNFYAAGGGCNNTGEIADVVYHEWGHGFHYYSVQTGTVDGALSEGVADTVATLQTRDSAIGPYFYTNGSAIRDVDDNLVYPDDVTGEVHNDGDIYAGAAWDFWTELLSTYGETRDQTGSAYQVAALDLAYALHSGPDVSESYDAYVLADDDDDDASNGSPHICELVTAFGYHGLGPGGTGGLLSLDHDPVGNQPADVPVEILGSVLNQAPACNTFNLSAASVHWSTDRGANWTETPLSVSGDAFDGNIPGLPDGTNVWYYVSGTASDGTVVEQPAGGDRAPYTFYVGGLTKIRCDDFETDDGGYTHELLSGRDREGADDWIWDAPTGTGGDPESAYSGRKVWGNDLGGGNYNGQYQDDIHNILYSSPFEIGDSTSVVVQFRRWLSVEDGLYDQATFSVNGTPDWVNHASSSSAGDEQTEDGEWKLYSTRLDGVTGPLNLTWEILSDGGLGFGGWTIDDVCVYSVVNYNGVFGIDDFNATDDQTGQVSLTWTQPSSADATHAVVVRRADRFAATKDDVGDGVVVFDADVTPGDAESIVDSATGTYFYSVFAGGDIGYLTGAEDPGNADDGTGLGEGGENGGGGDDSGTDGTGDNPDTGGTITLKATGCGCTTSTSDGATELGLLVGLAGLAVARRRR